MHLRYKMSRIQRSNVSCTFRGRIKCGVPCVKSWLDWETFAPSAFLPYRLQLAMLPICFIFPLSHHTGLSIS